MQREVLGIRKCILGAEHPDTLMAMHNLAFSLSNQGQYKEAEAMQREVVDNQLCIIGRDHLHFEGSVRLLAELLQAQGKNKDATMFLAKYGLTQ